MRKINNFGFKNKIFFSLAAAFATLFCMNQVYSSGESIEMQVLEGGGCTTNPVAIKAREFGEYKVTVYQTDDWTCQRLEVQKQGEVVYSEAEVDAHFFYGAEWNEKGPLFTHLTGRNAPELVISKWTGGAHCCFSVLIFEIGREFRKIGEIGGGNYYPYFEDIDGDGVLEVKVDDDFLAYRFSSFAFTAIAGVILKYSKGRYEISTEHMVKAPTDWSLLGKQIPNWQKELRVSEHPDYPPPTFIQAVTDLVFTGNKVTALELIDRAWPVDVPGKNEFLTSYEEALQASRYYSDFEKQL